MEKVNCALDRLVDFVRLCSQDSKYNTTLDVWHLPRLSEAVIRSDDYATLNLHFYVDPQGVKVIEGTASINVYMTCERCQKEMLIPLNAKFKATFEQEKLKNHRIEENYDIFDLDDNQKFDLYTFVEDFLLIEIPIIVRHEDNDENCELQGTTWEYGKIDEENLENNPFAILQSLKNKN